MNTKSRGKKTRKGRLIVIEGTDGSGKKTQTALLEQALRQHGYPVVTLAFPQYGAKSAGLVEEYLNGKYGAKPTDVNPYVASLFYALDRFDAATKIRAWLASGKIVLLDRYVDSNVAHQGGKIANPAQRKKFIAWLYDLEYRILGVPKPDIVFILFVPSRIGQQLVAKKSTRAYLKKGTHDIHEADLRHLKDAEQSYLWLAKTYPKDHRVIACLENKHLLSPEQIHGKMWGVLEQELKRRKI